MTRQDFAALRAYLQGLPLAKIGELYLDGPVDSRIVRSRIRAVTDAVKLLALRQKRPDVRRLSVMRVPQEEGEGTKAQVPTLADFSAAIGGEGFYTEAELLDMFRERYGRVEDRKTRRNARLRERQLAALKWAEQQLAATPVIEDPLSAWLMPHWVKRLAKVKLSTVGDLIAFINTHGARWWEAVPKLGERSARQIGQFLSTHHVTLGGRLAIGALVPRRQRAHADLLKARGQVAGIAPIESILCPDELDGSVGTNRNTRDSPLIEARNDLDALRAWLSQYENSKNTFRAYRRDAERLLLWCLFEAKKPLSSLMVEDCVAYRQFLASDKTGTRWAGKRGAERWSRAWRPFEEGTLTPGSVDQAMMVASHLFEWLVAQCYLAGNPMKAVPSARRTRIADEAGRHALKARARDEGARTRAFSVRLWQQVVAVMAAQPDDANWARARLVLQLGQATGLRARELIESQVRDLVRLADEESGECFNVLSVAGKGDKYREVVVPEPIMALISAHLVHRGLQADVFDNEGDVYLIGRTTFTPYWSSGTLVTPEAKSGISYEMLYRIVKEAFLRIGEQIARKGDTEAQQLAAASTHWLRHCFGAHQRQSGVDLRFIQEALGHSSVRTTAQYSQASVIERGKAMGQGEAAEGEPVAGSV